MQHFISALSTLLYAASCTAHVIRSPPPLHSQFSDAEWACSGHRDGWRWDRCSVDGAVLWTAMAFGHIGFSHESSNSMGRHVQYTPFTEQLPFVVSLQSHELGERFALPPMLLAVYIQDEQQRSLSWDAKLTLFLERGAGWIEQTTMVAFKSDGDAAPRQGDALIFKTNTEYIADNLLFHAFSNMLFIQPLEPGVYWLSLHASLEPLTHARPLGTDVQWHSQLPIAYRRAALASPSPALSPELDRTGRSSIRRAFASLALRLCRFSCQKLYFAAIR